MKTPKTLIASLLALVGFLAAAADDPWQRDLTALQQGLAQNYANFQYLLTERRLDLPALAARDRAALAAAGTDSERRRVFERLLNELRDPHVRIRWPAAGATVTAPYAADAPAPIAAPVCSAGNWVLGVSPGITFDQLPGWTALAGDEPRLFSAGLLSTPGSVLAGVLRFPVFIESAYEPACRHAAASLRLAPADACDTGCEERRDSLAANYLTAALRSTIAALHAAGALQIVVDVTNNPGGSDWSETVARMLAGPMPSARVSMLRHRAWLAWVDRELSGASVDDAALLQRLRASLAKRCDLSAAWSDSALATGRHPLPCSTLVDNGLYTQGLSPTPRGMAEPAATSLPLTVFVDNRTHSSAEQFAAMLQDHRRALLLGVPTAGAGCGHYIGGDGTAFTLPESGARVEVPDCVRLRADGSNERRGIVPDRLLPWAPSDSAWQRAVKAAVALARSVSDR